MHATMKIIGMTCAACSARIERVVAKVEGVESVSVNLATEILNCDFDDSKISVDTVKQAVEKPAYIYVSEISHNFRGKSYFYAGGYYRRSHMKNVLTGSSYNNLEKVKTEDFDPNNIDYYLGLSKEQKIGDTVLGCFRTQFFVTRSDIILVEGIQSGNPEIVGRYTALGERIEV